MGLAKMNRQKKDAEMETTKNARLINDFYSAFQKRDAQKMADCYHEQIAFNDPAFGTLNGAEAAMMWKMLCKSANDLRVEYEIRSITENTARVRWEAFYSYGKDKRKVHNKVNAELEIADDKIIRHTDKYSLWKWAAQTMGLNGMLIGGTPFFRKRLQKQSKEMLQRFLSRSKTK